MKKLFKIIFIILLLIIFLTSFSESYEYLSLDNLAVVVAIAIDTSEKDEMQLSFQFSKTSPSSDSGSSNSSSSFVYTLDASSITNGISLLNTYLEKEVTLSHCKLIAFSESFAKDGISNEIYTLINNPQIRPSTNIVITKSTAKEYIETIKPNFETLLSEYYDIYSTSSQFTGYTPNSQIGHFFHTMECEFCEPSAILGGISNDQSVTESSSGSKESSNNSPLSSPVSSENIGIAVFNDDKFIGELNALESISYLATNNNISGFSVSIPDPYEANSFIDIYLTPTNKTNVDVDISNGSPYVKIDYSFKATVTSLKPDSKYLDNDVLIDLSRSTNIYLENIFIDYFYKTAKEFESDITGIGKHVKSSFLTVQESEAYNWSNNYSDSFFEITVNTNINSSSLLSET